MSPKTSVLVPAFLVLLAALGPLPTAAATSCSPTGPDAPCEFECSAGYYVEVSAPEGVTVVANCGGATASCTGPCTARSDVPAQWSEPGTCAATGAGAECGAGSSAGDPCTSDGAFSLGIVPIVDPVTGETIGYVDDRNFVLGNGIWVYLEDNDQEGLQRGGESVLLGAEDPEICNQSSDPDTLIL